MREFWDSPEGQTLALALSYGAREVGWDMVMESFWTKDKRDYLSEKAQQVGLGDKYSEIWGKPKVKIAEKYAEMYR
jgi:hypothetical protein